MSLNAPLSDPPPGVAKTETAKRILRTLFRHRRLQPGAGACAESPCEQCLGLHLPKVRRFVMGDEPVHFLLPSFPAKSPNRRKVLGILPDMAEELALKYLERVCREITEQYPPGARVTICSDGRVFSDLVGVAERDVTEYGRAIVSMLEQTGARSLDTLDLEDLFEIDDEAALREQLCAHYADSLATIEERVRTYEHHRTLFNGIHRFLFEDRLAIETGKSRTRLRNEARERALRVMQRSEAWGRLIQERFPMALRLSIHPQPPHSDKVGILLGDAEDTWLTPWHGVALKEHGRFRLVRRHEAEALGAEVVRRAGRASHYEMGEVS
jgi:pyoverdine/dityrosine biosynthesis protein Dit1